MFLSSISWPLLPIPVARPLGAFLSLTCHRLASRSLDLPWGACGLCARCTAFWLGLSVFILVPPPAPANTGRAMLLGFLLLLPLAVDGILQYAGLYESTNAVRTGTGMLAGAGAAIVLGAGLRAGSRP
jgi:uncharacterized membrane protein